MKKEAPARRRPAKVVPKPVEPPTPQSPMSVAEVVQTFNDAYRKVIERGDVAHVVLIGTLRGLLLNVEAEYLAMQAAARANAQRGG